MPIQTFLLLIIAVILAAGATIALASATGMSLTWLGMLALVLALVIRGLTWR
jgi:hypothetical protein